MAEKKPQPQPAAPAAESAARKKLPIKSAVAIAGIMAAEAAVFVAVLGMGGPQKGQAAEQQVNLKQDEGEQTQELLIVDDKFQNLQTGRVWIWDTAVYVQVKNKNAEAVKKILERRSAEIREGVSQVISRAQHAQLKEPERQTLNRQITAYLETVFEPIGDKGQSPIERVLIPKCRGFPADF
jgi:flagellar basal body-associated protein FliL